MTFREVDPVVSRLDGSAFIAGDEGDIVIQDSGKMGVRPGGKAQDTDFDITGHDLIADGDFVIPDDTDLDRAPNIGGSQWLSIALESTDDNSFEVTITWLTSAGDTLYEDTPTLEPDLAGTDVRVPAEVAGDRYNLTITDTSGGGQNNIRGSINSH